jgi:anti-anti-sigma factor
MNEPAKCDPPLTVKVTGDLISTNAAAVRGQIDSLLASLGNDPPPASTLRLDLAGAKMIDSVGLNLVVSALKAMQKRGGKLEVAYADTNVFRTFAFTRLDQQLQLIKV